MNAAYWLLTLCLSGPLLGSGAQAGIVARWDFNSTPADGDTGTGTTVPASGAGEVRVVGGTRESFAAGSTLDPAPGADNSAWNISGFPSQGTGNKTRGIQVSLSTAGYENISVSWQQRASASLSRYFRFQYTTDGSNFLDQQVFTLTASNVFIALSNNLAALPGIRDNPNFGFRLVSEIESTAAGGASTNYIPVGTNYSTAGVTRFDLLTVYGTPIPGGNTAPHISSLANQTTRVDTATSLNPFTIGDLESAAGALLLSASSSDPALVDAAQVVFAGVESNRTVRVTPKPGKIGAVSLTVRVTDPSGASASRSFELTVLPANTPPSLGSIPVQFTTVGAGINGVPFSVNDLETAPGSLIVTAVSSNPAMIPNGGISLAGTGTNRSVSILPAAGQVGVATITLTVSDGGLATNTVFAVNVTPAAPVLLYEPFDYPDGPLVQKPGSFWNTHSGLAQETMVTAGELEVSSVNSEDLSAPLKAGPYTNGFLYVKMGVRVRALPSNPEGGFFAHFKDNGTVNFRGRLFVSTLGAAGGAFRFGVANSGTNATLFNRDLQPGSNYTVVVRYDAAGPTTTLWVDPEAESGPSVTAADSANPIGVRTFAFRQAIGFGILEVQDVAVATSFAALFGSGSGMRLEATRQMDGSIRIAWPTAASNAGFVVESTSTLAETNWQIIPETVASQNGTDSIVVPAITGERFFRLRK